MGVGVGRVLELVGVEGAGLVGHGLGHLLVVLRVALADVRAGQAHVDAHGPQVQDLLPRHLVRHDQDQAVALEGRHLGQAKAGVAGGGLDDGSARLEASVPFGGLDHGQSHAVLDRPAGVLVLEFQEQSAQARIQPRQLQHGRAADQVQGRADGARSAALSR